MDRRLTPMADGIALRLVEGKVAADQFVAGDAGIICVSVTDLCVKPAGARDRQLLLGDAVTVVHHRDDWAFLQADKDGYCGWVRRDAIGPATEVTHWVSSVASHVYSGPKVQAPELMTLSMGARVKVLGLQGAFAETPLGFVPRVHLRQLDDRPDDPVKVAEMFLNTPYLWGGNSSAGLDCSGLVQLSYHACGLTCPGDSDLQQVIGHALSDDALFQRGDLVFWKGHVALVVDENRLIHANGYSMSVMYEGISDCVARISAEGGGGVTARRRP